jgi:hypothetical protein
VWWGFIARSNVMSVSEHLFENPKETTINAKIKHPLARLKMFRPILNLSATLY